MAASYGLVVDTPGAPPEVRAHLEGALALAGVSTVVLAEPQEALDEMAARAGDGGAPLVVVVGPGVGEPAGVGRRLHEAAPLAPLVFLRRGAPDSGELARELASPFALVGASWRVLAAGSDEVPGAIAAAAEIGRRRLRLRTTLDRFNLRFEAGPPADVSDLRRYTVSHRFLSGVLETAQDGIMAANDAGVVVLWNPGAERLFGRGAGDVVGRPLTHVCGGEWPERMPHLLDELRRSRATFTGRALTGRRPDGSLVHVEVSGSFLDAPEGGAFGVVLIAHDVSERRRIEAERARLDREMFQAQKRESLTEMAAGIAHECNNLLTVVLGHTELAMQGLAPGAPGRRSLDQVRTAAGRAAQLSLQMLAYSGRGAFVLGAIDLDALVDGMLKLLRASIPKGIVVQHVRAAAPPRIDADDAQMRQLVMNLVANSAEAMGERPGVITIRTSVRACDARTLREYLPNRLEPGDYVALEVADTGAGMDPLTAERVFDPFFSTKLTGRGLGLAAVHGIVRGHRGAVRLRSELGRGTIVACLFQPSGAPAPAAAAPEQPARVEPAGSAVGTVLVVDDEPGIRALAQRAVGGAGYTVVTAADGHEGVARFLERQDDVVLVLLDLTMPHLDGAAAMRRMRQARPGVRVLVISGYDRDGAAERLAGQRADGFLQKPFNVATLLDRVRECLRVPS